MDHLAEFKALFCETDEQLELFLFGWTGPDGKGGDYGLNVGPAQKTFQTLITTTYMFQPEPAFTLQCRAMHMTQAQFEYLQNHDLDTEAFLSQLGQLPPATYTLDLSQHKDAATALAAMETLIG
ncbi:hypothetical protein [Terasakiella sp. SH-1]|uniref:hypothetical protein n=1 Tax=Terasakiella sp. SH-1 TaxID=2560057 RepID=UPI0010737BCF|nr:hypothetical protein [Terasakiella sp. SH-1]